MTSIQAVRRFNRIYTRRIGLLREGLMDSAFSLTEVRVLYELAHRDRPTATDLVRELDLDPGYLSRILRRFEKQGLVSRERSKSDGRSSNLVITKAGRKAFAPLDRAADEQAASLLAALPPGGREQLVGAMAAIESLVGEQPVNPAPYVLRAHRPGDIGLVVHLHGKIYSQEYGWDERFEALVAGIAAKFIQNLDPTRERCWIAEKNGAVVGSVFLVKQSEAVAKLRLLIVDPSARGLGIGNRLVAECVQFAREAGYQTVTLWTQDVLRVAQHIYERAGFRLAREEPHCEFGIPLTAQIWDLQL